MSLDKFHGQIGNPAEDFHTHKIDGQSRVTVYAQNIYVGDKIDGQSKVYLHAPGGRIVIGGKIDGQSSVYAYCKELVVNEKIDGQCYVGYTGIGSVGQGVHGRSQFVKM